MYCFIYKFVNKNVLYNIVSYLNLVIYLFTFRNWILQEWAHNYMDYKLSRYHEYGTP